MESQLIGLGSLSKFSHCYLMQSFKSRSTNIICTPTPRAIFAPLFLGPQICGPSPGYFRDRALGVAILQGFGRTRFLVQEVPLYIQGTDPGEMKASVLTPALSGYEWCEKRCIRSVRDRSRRTVLAAEGNLRPEWTCLRGASVLHEPCMPRRQLPAAPALLSLSPRLRFSAPLTRRTLSYKFRNPLFAHLPFLPFFPPGSGFKVQGSEFRV